MKKVLFISWDGPQTSYMEGLFFPIFNEVQKMGAYEFHVMQFTWADKVKLHAVEKEADAHGIHYTSCRIYRKPFASLGSIFTITIAPRLIKKYIKDNSIDILMPRSTSPAIMVNRLSNISSSVIFDADGLPIDERVDFTGLSRTSWKYKKLKQVEKKLLINADKVITRSQRSIDIHVNAIGESYRSKFSIVTNGRNINHFSSNESERSRIRSSFGLNEEDKLFIYCGSLGPQYGWHEMQAIFIDYKTDFPKTQFLILTGNVDFAKSHLDDRIKTSCRIMKVPFEKVPNYLSAGDIGFAIREPSYSMSGVAPIKLGEYVLMGLPTIASKGIGDTEEILRNIPGNYLFDHDDPDRIKNAVNFVKGLRVDKNQLREHGIKYFSLTQSAKSYIEVLDSL